MTLLSQKWNCGLLISFDPYYKNILDDKVFLESWFVSVVIWQIYQKFQQEGILFVFLHYDHFRYYA